MKRNQNLYELFVDELEVMLNCENQLIESISSFIKLASANELKEALAAHLGETEDQAKRVKKIFSILHVTPKERSGKGIKGILDEAKELFKGEKKDPTLDAAIISAAQKIELYEVASYGTLLSFAKHLDLDGEIIDALKKNLAEEQAADKKLTKIADGTLFSSGINTEAADAAKHDKKK